ncbi:hypothetical protein BDZ91DRAFT_739446 [Kalaharituber pfeilii]|nr:hypothetical protein BDZ91DRAFT_739446 [Kalaharituber pfeilii]
MHVMTQVLHFQFASILPVFARFGESHASLKAWVQPLSFTSLLERWRGRSGKKRARKENKRWEDLVYRMIMTG